MDLALPEKTDLIRSPNLFTSVCKNGFKPILMGYYEQPQQYLYSINLFSNL